MGTTTRRVTISAMKHYLFGILAGMSMLLFLATAGMWVRSFRSKSDINFVAADRIWNLKVRRDLFWVTTAQGWKAGDLHSGDRVQFFSRKTDAVSGWNTNFISFNYGSGVSGTTVSGTTFSFQRPGRRICVGCNLWLLAVLTLAVPLAWGAAWRLSSIRRRKIRSRLCLVCGYDLRSTPDRCPECGTSPSKPTRRVVTPG
jgi:hypothetical protein